MGHYSRIMMRQPGRNAGQGLTTASLGAVDVDVLLHQHAAYADAMKRIGLEVKVLPALEHFPDAYFVEDTAVIVPEVAVLTRPGAPERRDEPLDMESALAEFRPIERIVSPGTLDGGDVLIVGSRCFVGLSDRTNPCGFAQLRDFLSPFGYTCAPVPVSAGLHLKSSVNAVGPDTLVVAPGFEDHPDFQAFSRITLDGEEAYAANSLWIDEHLFMPKGFPKTRQKYQSLGLNLIELDMSEMCKMDGGLTCLSLRF